MSTTYRQLYLNNSGHRWINVDSRGKHDRVNVYDPLTKVTKSYAVAYYEAIGNFAVAYVKIKGKIEQLTDYMDDRVMVNSGINRALRHKDAVELLNQSNKRKGQL